MSINSRYDVRKDLNLKENCKSEMIANAFFLCLDYRIKKIFGFVEQLNFDFNF